MNLDRIMSRRKKFIIIFIALVIVTLGLWLIFSGDSDVLVKAPESPVVQTAKSTAEASNAAPATATEIQTASLESLARSFAERYGSYSNQSDFENLEDLYPFMTDKMRQYSQTYIAEQRARVGRDESIYSGTTTRALNVTFVSRGDSTAVLNVATQRRESGAGLAEPKVYYQDLKLSLLKIGETWEVDEAEWQ